MYSVFTKSPARLSSGTRITSVQGLRGLAACLVAAMHCLSSKGGLTGPSTPQLHQITMMFCAVGGAGVDIFFVISGFIIMTLSQRRIMGENRFVEAARFLLRRFGRIYPLYWVTVLAILASVSWYTRNIADYHIAISVRDLLLTTTQPAVQPPAWTLAFELWFYCGTATLMLLPTRFFNKALLAWALAQAGLLVMQAELGLALHWHIFTQPQVLDFFLGCAVAHACARRVLSPTNAIALLFASAVIFLCGCAVCFLRLPSGSLTDGERLLYWGSSAAIMLSSLISLEVRNRLRTPAWLQRLGDISYSTYLWHYPIMAAAFSFGLEDMIASDKILQAALEFFATLLIASLSYRCIERPTMRFVHHLSRPRTLRIQQA